MSGQTDLAIVCLFCGICKSKARTKQGISFMARQKDITLWSADILKILLISVTNKTSPTSCMYVCMYVCIRIYIYVAVRQAH